MIKKNKLKAMILMISLMFIIQIGAAQPPVDNGGADDFPPPTDNPPVDNGGADDFPSAPIDDYILPMALLGIAGGYWLTRKRKADDMAE